MDAVSLKGLERVISVTIGGDSLVDSPDAAGAVQSAVNGAKGKEVASIIGGGEKQKGSGGDYDEEKGLPLVYFRTYTISFLRSGVPTPLVALSPHGPHLTFSLRRSQLPSAEMWKASMKKTVKKSSNGPKVSKNVDVDEMGDKVGRIYVDSQDLSGLQSRKFKGLRKTGSKEEEKEKKEKKASDAMEEGTEVNEVQGKVGGGEGRKRMKI